jgi:general secretion pathway protein J
MTGPAAPRDPAAGVTLVEMLVALALMAIIGVAGFAVLEQVLRAQERTADRLARLGQMQRAMHLISLDFATALPGSLETGADAAAVGIARQGKAVMRVDYRLDGGTLWRAVSEPAGQPLARQALLPDVAAGSWRFLSGRQWSDRWPPDGTAARLGTAPNPRAVELRLTLADGGALRRVALLPSGAP